MKGHSNDKYENTQFISLKLQAMREAQLDELATFNI